MCAQVWLCLVGVALLCGVAQYAIASPAAQSVHPTVYVYIYTSVALSEHSVDSRGTVCICYTFPWDR